MPRPHRVRAVAAVPAVALVTALAACGSSHTGAKATTPTAPPSAPTTASPSTTTGGSATGATTAITTAWTTFFDAKTPTATRVSLLQNGSQFASVLASQAKSPLASESSARVTSVSVTSPTAATVHYDILLGSTPALTNQTGTAVEQGGAWKVGDASFCGLLRLEAGGSSSGLPAACATGS